jgi:hypothetical protein
MQSNDSSISSLEHVDGQLQHGSVATATTRGSRLWAATPGLPIAQPRSQHPQGCSVGMKWMLYLRTPWSSLLRSAAAWKQISASARQTYLAALCRRTAAGFLCQASSTAAGRPQRSRATVGYVWWPYSCMWPGHRTQWGPMPPARLGAGAVASAILHKSQSQQGSSRSGFMARATCCHDRATAAAFCW